MSKGRVADDGNSRPLTSVGSTLGHGDRCTHINTRVNGAERRQEAQRIATDIAENTGILVIFQHLVQGCIHVAVTTTLTQCRRTGSHVGTGIKTVVNFHAQCLFYDIWIQFTRTGQCAVELTFDVLALVDTTNNVLDKWLAFLNYEYLVTLVQHTAHQFLRQRILRNLQDWVGASLWETLVDIVKANTAGNDTQRLILPLAIDVIGGLGGIVLKLSLLGSYHVVTLAGVGRQQNPVGCYCVVVQLVLLTGLVLHFHHSTAMSHAGGDTHQHGQLLLLRIFESGLYHVVGLLLVRRFERRNHSEFAIETRILLVLRGVHRGVIGY